MRGMIAAAFCCGLAGCTAFPGSPREAKVQIDDIKAALECELVAAASMPKGLSRGLSNWDVGSDLDITLERNFSADGTVTVGIPTGPGKISGIPSIGGSDTDTKQSQLKFGTSITRALLNPRYARCAGDNPSETNMGLANWIEGSLKALREDELVTVSYVNTFKIAVNGGVKFGYVLVPVVNPVDAGVGFSMYRNYTNRISITLTPPIKPKKISAIHVIIDNKSLVVRPAERDNAFIGEGAGGSPPPGKKAENDNKDAGAARPDTPRANPRAGKPRNLRRQQSLPGDSPRDRVLNNQILREQLLRNAPTFRSN